MELSVFTEWDDVMYPPPSRLPREEIQEPEWLAQEDVLSSGASDESVLDPPPLRQQPEWLVQEDIDPELDALFFGGGRGMENPLDRPLFDGWGVIPHDLFVDDPWVLWQDEPLQVEEPVPSREEEEQQDEPTCPVCMDVYNDDLAVLVFCGHYFHRDCLVR